MSTFDPVLGEFDSNYELIVANPNDADGPWQAQRLQLVIQTLADPSGPDNPNGFPNPQRSLLTITDNLAPTFSMGPGVRQRQDFKYCFGEVTMNFSTSDGSNFYNPEAKVTGQFTGSNFLNQNADYWVDGDFFGTPKNASNEASAGQVSLTLPEGTYIITPTVQTGNPPSTTQFVKTTVDKLGCGQRRGVGKIAVSVDKLPQCAPASGQIDINGTVNTAGNIIVSRIYYTVNGGPEIDICSSDCGDDPTYTEPVSVVNGNNTITVFATSASNIEPPAFATDQIEFGTPQCDVACDIDGDSDIDKLDLKAISRARGTFDVKFDINGDGTINPADVKACIPLCTLPRCATQ